MSLILDALNRADAERGARDDGVGDKAASATIGTPAAALAPIEPTSGRRGRYWVLVTGVNLALLIAVAWLAQWPGLAPRAPGAVTAESSPTRIEPTPAPALAGPAAEPIRSKRAPERAQPPPAAAEPPPIDDARSGVAATPAAVSTTTPDARANTDANANPATAALDAVIAGWSLSSHIYSESSADRLVIINGTALTEGDAIGSELGPIRIERIDPDGIAVRQGDSRREIALTTLWR